MAPRRQPAVWEFPGVFAIWGALGLFAVTWPWLVLHGSAEVIVGLLWTALAALTAAAVTLGRRQAR